MGFGDVFCVTLSITRRIHALYFTDIWLNFMLNVGKLIYIYTDIPYMDGMGMGLLIALLIC